MLRCNHHHQGGHYVSLLKLQLLKQSLTPNSAADIHEQGPDNICSHSTRLITPMYFN